MTGQYDTKGYWDERYSRSEAPFDWTCSFHDVAPTLLPLLPSDRSASILVVGCGDSPFSADLALRGGYRDVLSVDYSDVVVEKMRVRWPQLRFEVMDCLCMDGIESSSFGAS